MKLRQLAMGALVVFAVGCSETKTPVTPSTTDAQTQLASNANPPATVDPPATPPSDTPPVPPVGQPPTTPTPPGETPPAVPAGNNCEAEKSLFVIKEKLVQVTNNASACTNTYLAVVLRSNTAGTVTDLWEAKSVTLAPGRSGEIALNKAQMCDQPRIIRVFFGMREDEVGVEGRNVRPETSTRVSAASLIGRTEACDATPPSGPTPPPSPPPSTPLPPTTPAGEQCRVLGNTSTTNGTLWVVSNDHTSACTWTTVMWRMKVPYGAPNWQDQDFFAWEERTIQPKQVVTMTLPLPPCKPNEPQHWQSDPYPASKSELGPNAVKGRSDALVITNKGAYLGTVAACPPPPPPPPPVVKATASLAKIGCEGKVGSFTTLLSVSLQNATMVIDGPGSDDKTVTVSSAFGVTWPAGTYNWTATAKPGATFEGPSSGSFTAVDCSTPPPPPCSTTNPPKFNVLSATVVQSGYDKDDVKVTVSYEYANLQNQKLAIFWVGKYGSQWVKEPVQELNVSCEAGKKTLTFSWTSYDKAHLVTEGATYYVIRFTGPNPTTLQDPDIIGTPLKITSVTKP